MDPISLILRRLATGASAGTVEAAKDSGKDAVVAAYSKSRGLVEAGASLDADLVAAAKALMELVEEAGACSGKYVVTIKDSEGVQVGDGNIQINTYSDRGSRRDG